MRAVEGNLGRLPYGEVRKNADGRTPTLVLCSRNAHDKNVLVRRPHIDQHGCHSKRGNARPCDHSGSQALAHCKGILDRYAGLAQDGSVIENFRNKGLARFFEDDDRRKLPVSQIDKIPRILARLNEAIAVQDMGLGL